MKCQPVRCWPRRNGLASAASWNWLNVSETLMMSVSLWATSAGLALAAWAGACVGLALAGFTSAAGLAASAGLAAWAGPFAAAGAAGAVGGTGAVGGAAPVGFGGIGT